MVLVWGFGDVASTLLAAAATSTPTRELNPLVGFLLQIDPLLVVLLKAIVVGTAAAALLASRDVVEGLPGWRAWFATMVAVGSLVVGNNLLVAVDALG